MPDAYPSIAQHELVALPALRRATVQPVITAGLYATGQCLGPLQSFAADVLFRHGVNAGILRSLTIADRDAQSAAIDLLFFSDNPVNSTFTDHVAPTVAAADLPLFQGFAQVPTASYIALNGKSLGQTNANLWLPLVTLNGTLYVQAICRGTPTYTTTSSLTLGLLVDPE